MKKVIFKSQFRCSVDGGKSVSKFNAKQEAELPDDVADSAVKSGAASLVGGRKAKKPVEDKAKKPDANKGK